MSLFVFFRSNSIQPTAESSMVCTEENENFYDEVAQNEAPDPSLYAVVRKPQRHYPVAVDLSNGVVATNATDNLNKHGAEVDKHLQEETLDVYAVVHKNSKTGI